MYIYRKYNEGLQKLLFLPIHLALVERKIKYKDFVLMCNENGLKLNIYTLKIIQQGKHRHAEHFNIFTKIYVLLNLPPITLDYLIECRDRYNELRPKRKLNKL